MVATSMHDVRRMHATSTITLAVGHRLLSVPVGTDKCSYKTNPDSPARAGSTPWRGPTRRSSSSTAAPAATRAKSWALTCWPGGTGWCRGTSSNWLAFATAVFIYSTDLAKALRRNVVMDNLHDLAREVKNSCATREIYSGSV
jgi:hypothetical protein